MLVGLSDKNTKGKALCIANILKIAIRFLGDNNYKKYIKLGETCNFIVDFLNIDKNENWYREFEEIYKEIQENDKILKEKEKEMRNNIKNKYKEDFDEIDSKFNKRKDNSEFIKYILKKKPYKEYEEDKKSKKLESYKDTQDLLNYLKPKYHPDNYSFNDDEQTQLDYVLTEYIMSYLNRMFQNI